MRRTVAHSQPSPLTHRPTMIKYGINNIRELVGHKVNLQMVYDSPICRLESWGSPKLYHYYYYYYLDGPTLRLPRDASFRRLAWVSPPPLLLILANLSSASRTSRCESDHSRKRVCFSPTLQTTTNCFSKGFNTQEQPLCELNTLLPRKASVQGTAFLYITLPQLLQQTTYLYRKKYFWNMTKVQ